MGIYLAIMAFSSAISFNLVGRLAAAVYIVEPKDAELSYH